MPMFLPTNHSTRLSGPPAHLAPFRWRWSSRWRCCLAAWWPLSSTTAATPSQPAAGAAQASSAGAALCPLVVVQHPAACKGELQPLAGGMHTS